jgi:hypothetical protein
MAKQAKRQLAGSGETLPAGAVGEVRNGSATRSFTSNTSTTTGWALSSSVVEMTLTAGIWLVVWKVSINVTSGTTSGSRTAIITTDTTDGPGSTSNLCNDGGNMDWPTTTSPTGTELRTQSDIVTVTGSSINVRVKVYAQTHSSFTGSYNASYRAIRIA